MSAGGEQSPPVGFDNGVNFMNYKVLIADDEKEIRNLLRLYLENDGFSVADVASGEEVDMGGTFDYFDVRSHPDYTGITSEQYQNRMILREAMLNNGFYPCSTEWWDFTLNNEPYPSTYFDFPVSLSSLNNY